MDAIGVSRSRWALRHMLTAVLLTTSGGAFADAPPPPPPPPGSASLPSDFVLPQAVYNPPPRYPTGSADAQEAGTVVLTLKVDAEGGITGVTLDRSSGYPKLDAAAKEAAASWRFTPALDGGKPVRSMVRVPVTFVAE